MILTYKGLFGSDHPEESRPRDFMEWRDHLSVNHPVLDAQHKAIYDLGSQIYRDWLDGAKVDVLRTAIAQLEALIEEHFSTEEQILMEIGYEKLAQHKNEHRSMLETLRTCRNNLNALDAGIDMPRGSVTSPGWPIMQLIIAFSMGHVMTSDKDYSAVLLAKGTPPLPTMGIDSL
jgi:hemerythrin-like metal-binding protein